jgi:general secretion pathway protein J
MRRAFSLIEVVVAMALLALMGTLSFQTVLGSLDARDRLEADDEMNQAARIALSTIKRDLSLAWLTPNIQAVASYRTLFVAQDESPDKLFFAAMSHQRLHQGARECDQTEITYWTEEDPTNKDALVLLRREAPRIDHEPEKDGAILPLAYGLKRFDVRFQDPVDNEWRDDWDTTGTETPGRLPRAAQVILEVLGPDPDDEDAKIAHTFMTTVILEFGAPLKRDAFAGSGK